METRIDGPEVKLLCETLAAIDDAHVISNLLQDCCTIREVQELAQRLHVAQMLDAGRSYATIQEETGASATTIARVSKSLNYGAGGYRYVLDEVLDTGGKLDDAPGRAI